MIINKYIILYYIILYVPQNNNDFQPHIAYICNSLFGHDFQLHSVFLIHEW